MTDYTTGIENPTDGIDLPHDAYRLGVDEAGRDHWHSPRAARVWVFRDGEDVHQEDLAGRSVVDWILFVADELAGWEEHEPVDEHDGLRGLVDDTEREVA